MTISVVQASGTPNDDTTNSTHAFGSNVSVGNKILVASFRYAGTNSATYVSGDCTKSAGTATLGTITLRAAITVAYETGFYLKVGIWEAEVTGSGSLTMQISGSGGSYWGTAGIELATSTSWEAGFVEDTATNSTSSDNTSASTGAMQSAGAAIYIGVMSVSNNGGTVSITPGTINGVTPTTVLEQENEDVNGIGSVVYALQTGATDDDVAWTLGNNLGWAAAGIVIKDEAGGGGFQSAWAINSNPPIL